MICGTKNFSKIIARVHKEYITETKQIMKSAKAN